MEIYFANNSGKPTKLLFNSNQAQQPPQQQQAPRQMAVSRKSVLMQDKEQTLKDRIKVEVVGLSYYKLKVNPIIYAFNTDDILTSQRVENIDFLDQIQLKNQQKRQSYQDILTISNQLSSLGETKTIIKRPPTMNDPVKQIMNLTGCDYKRSQNYHKKYGSVQKAYSGYINERKAVQQFMKKHNTNAQYAIFYLESSDYNSEQAARLMTGGK